MSLGLEMGASRTAPARTCRCSPRSRSGPTLSTCNKRRPHPSALPPASRDCAVSLIRVAIFSAPPSHLDSCLHPSKTTRRLQCSVQSPTCIFSTTQTSSRDLQADLQRAGARRRHPCLPANSETPNARLPTRPRHVLDVLRTRAPSHNRHVHRLRRCNRSSAISGEFSLVHGKAARPCLDAFDPTLPRPHHLTLLLQAPSIDPTSDLPSPPGH